MAVTGKGTTDLKTTNTRSDGQEQEAMSVVTVELLTSREIIESDVKYDFVPDPFFRLRSFDSIMFATILEDVIITLRILDECNNGSRVSRVLDDLENRLKKKYSIKPPAIQKPELDLIDPKQLGCNKYKMHKLEKDRSEVFNSILATYVNLTESQSFRELWIIYQNILDQEYYEECIKRTYDMNKTLARSLHRHLRQLQIQQKSAMYESDSINDAREKQINDAEQMAAIEDRYTERWQNARSEQCLEDLYSKERACQDSIQYYKSRKSQESLVHSEVEFLNSIQINEVLQQVEALMQKYDDDMEEMDLKIQIKMSEVYKITESNKELQDELKRNEYDMKAWIKFKVDRAKERKYLKEMTRSACVVQAWWRGIIVRMQLGPYRNKKEEKPIKKEEKPNKKEEKPNKKK